MHELGCITGIRGYFYNEMRYINLRFTYLLTYLLTYYNILRITESNNNSCFHVQNIYIKGFSFPYTGASCHWASLQGESSRPPYFTPPPNLKSFVNNRRFSVTTITMHYPLCTKAYTSYAGGHSTGAKHYTQSTIMTASDVRR